jgi:hypothetical protein
VVKRLFNFVTPIIVPNANIEEFRAKSKANGRLTSFEVIVGGRKVVQLHMRQHNFLAAVAAARRFNPTVSEPAANAGAP